MLFCPANGAIDSVPKFITSPNNNSVVTMIMCSTAPSSRSTTNTIPDPGAPISILDFAAMTHEQQKSWLKDSATRSTIHPSTSRKVCVGQRRESALHGTTKNSVQLSQPLDDSSVSSSSYTSDCDDDTKVVRIPNKRSIFAPYWDKSEHDGSDRAEEGSSSSASFRSHHALTITRPRHQSGQPLGDVISAALDLCRAPFAEDSLLRVPAAETANILPNLLRDLSFADALLVPETVPDFRKSAPALSPFGCIKGLRSMSSILKNVPTGSSEPLSTKTVIKHKPPVSFDPRVQVIVFQQDKPSRGPMKLPPWLSRSLNSLLYEFGTGEDP